MRWTGSLSFVLLVLAWLALDDITTDNATGRFVPEYSMLVVGGIWFAAVGVWLLARRRFVAGILSLSAVALAIVAFWSLPHHYGPASLVNYLGLIPLAWFLGLAIWLVAPHRAAPPHREITVP